MFIDICICRQLCWNIVANNLKFIDGLLLSSHKVSSNWTIFPYILSDHCPYLGQGISLPWWSPILKDSTLLTRVSEKNKKETFSSRAFSLWQGLGICSACLIYSTMLHIPLQWTLSWFFDHMYLVLYPFVRIPGYLLFAWTLSLLLTSAIGCLPTWMWIPPMSTFYNCSNVAA